MKGAVATDDGLSMSAHFGRARAYLVITVGDGKVVEREIRPKAAPHLDQPSVAPAPTPAQWSTVLFPIWEAVGPRPRGIAAAPRTPEPVP